MMSWFYNLKISAKLIIGFLLVAVIAGIVGIVGLVNVNNMSEADVLLYEDNTLGIQHISDAALLFLRMRFNASRLLLFEGDKKGQDESIEKIKNHKTNAEEYFKMYEGVITDAAEQKLYEELKSKWEKI